MLQWFEHNLHEGVQIGATESLKKFFQEKDILDALWGAATAKALSPYATIRLNKFFLSLKKLGISVKLPPWWEATIKQYLAANPTQ